MDVFTEKIYNIIKENSVGLDSIYSDYIVHMVGMVGLNTLKEHKLIEGCGSINGRKLYILCDLNVED